MTEKKILFRMTKKKKTSVQDDRKQVVILTKSDLGRISYPLNNSTLMRSFTSPPAGGFVQDDIQRGVSKNINNIK